jgi:hypothetical protein
VSLPIPPRRPLPPTARTILTCENWRHFNAEERAQAEGIAATMLKAQQAAGLLELKERVGETLSPLDAATLKTLREVTDDGNRGLAIIVMMATARRQLPKQN